jgi:hypothetical protein
MIVISDTTPLVYLHRIEKLDLLEQLFRRIYIPEAVSRELQLGQHDEAALQNLEWLEITSVKDLAMVKLLAQDLDRGEAEVLALALERPVDWVILDDSLARTAAALLRIPFIGTIGILLLSKTRGLIPSVKEPLDAMVTAGLWVAPELYEEILQKIGEC